MMNKRFQKNLPSICKPQQPPVSESKAITAPWRSMLPCKPGNNSLIDRTFNNIPIFDPMCKAN